MSRFVVLLLTALSIVCLLLVPLGNYFIDPSGIYRSNIDNSVEGEAIDIILDGLNAEGLDNYDERLIKRMLIYNTGEHECIVLGSSRAAMISKECLCEDDLLNLSVTGAALRDVIGIYGVYSMQGFSAKRIVFSLDPWFLNSNYSSRRFEDVLNDGYYNYLADIMKYPKENIDVSSTEVNQIYIGGESSQSFWDFSFDKKMGLFSIPYFQSSLASVFDPKSGDIVATNEYWTVSGSLRSDGSYCYPESYRNNSYDQVMELAEFQTLPVDENKSRIIGCEDMSGSDPNYDLFYDFVKSLCDSGIDVQIVMTPLNPVLYDFMLEHDRYNPVIESESWFIDVSNELGISIVGSFNPHVFNAEVMDFYDGYHCKAEFVQEIVAALDKR